MPWPRAVTTKGAGCRSSSRRTQATPGWLPGRRCPQPEAAHKRPGEVGAPPATAHVCYVPHTQHAHLSHILHNPHSPHTHTPSTHLTHATETHTPHKPHHTPHHTPHSTHGHTLHPPDATHVPHTQYQQPHTTCPQHRAHTHVLCTPDTHSAPRIPQVPAPLGLYCLLSATLLWAPHPELCSVPHAPHGQPTVWQAA